MEKIIRFTENGIHLVFKISEEGEVYFLHCQKREFQRQDITPDQEAWYRLVELQAAGEDQDDHHGSKYTGTLPGRRLRYESSAEERNEKGRLFSIRQRDGQTGLTVVSHFQFAESASVLESYTMVENEGAEAVGLTYVSGFCLNGLTKASAQPWDQAAVLKVPSNTWYGEFQWRDYTLPGLGLSRVSHYSTKRLSFSATGTWTSHEFLPMGYVENRFTGEGWFFSIVHNGSWHWEISDSRDALYLQVSGPTEAENHWYKRLLPGEGFESVHVAVAVTVEGFEDAVAQMTAWRRQRRRKNADNERLPVIFNDFMNCLEGNPTEEKEYPLIDAAAAVGCEYYTIDAGWYADGGWWDRVGEWRPAEKRWPNGLRTVLSYIRQKGMIPGLWLEAEVMGIHCPIAKEKPDDWFFCRHGKRVIDHGRYQLDYRNPAVRAFADEVIRRLVEDYGAGYIKMDYNINAGIGTELGADSAGDGLLGHNRAYLAWLDGVFDRYPDLIIENCGSGGMRINDALLLRHSIQSSSDQTDYIRYAAISAAAAAAVTPEQNAVWSYPLADADAEQVAFNMVNAMLMRIHQSGHLGKLGEERLALIREGIDYYKSYRQLIAQSVPVWPLGLPSVGDKWICVAFENDVCVHLAVWRVGDGEDVPERSVEGSRTLALGGLRHVPKRAEAVYPKALPCQIKWNAKRRELAVSQPVGSARLIRLTW